METSFYMLLLHVKTTEKLNSMDNILLVAEREHVTGDNREEEEGDKLRLTKFIYQ